MIIKKRGYKKESAAADAENSGEAVLLTREASGGADP